MSLWRLEVLRLTRTHRWMILLGVYLSFGVVGPLSARYFNELMQRAGGEITIIAPDPRPVDGLTQFLENAGLFGLLAVVIVGAGALAMDASPEASAFLRSRTEHARTLLLPRYVVPTVAAIIALLLATALTWALTASLGSLPPGRLLLGTALGAAYLAFALAVVAAVAGFAHSRTSTVFSTLVILLALPLLGTAAGVRPWLPSELLTAAVPLVEGAPVGDYLRATLTTLVVTVALLVLAAHRFDAREL
jgi:ABC-2 type transport system permease protein